MPVNLPTNLLRSFVAIVDTGSMLNASEQVFVTQSALSLQIKRLEELVQQSLFLREGRRLHLTAAGEVLLDYARRVLSLHDEAVAAVSAGRFAGPARIGMVQDFADSLLSGLLSRFAELHPDAQIYARVAGTAELQALLDRRELDILLGFAAPNDGSAVTVAPHPVHTGSRIARTSAPCHGMRSRTWPTDAARASRSNSFATCSDLASCPFVHVIRASRSRRTR